MKIAVTGSRGLVGTALLPGLTENGHTIIRLVRAASSAPSNDVGEQMATAQWDPRGGQIDTDALVGTDAVVHLAGENIAAGRWTAAQKERILKSRTEGTRLVAESIARMDPAPKCLISASAIGIYGDRGDARLDESAAPGDGFLSDVVQEWEAACQPARDAGIRVVNLRFGVILSPDDGALAKMLLPFKLGAGGRVGSGDQYWSWVAIDDVAAAIVYALEDDQLTGPVNVVAPNPVTNREFTKTLGRVLRRPTIAPLPAFVARIMLGEMADELLLASARVEPSCLVKSNFEFAYPDLEPCLRHLLSR